MVYHVLVHNKHHKTCNVRYSEMLAPISSIVDIIDSIYIASYNKYIATISQ